MTKYTPGPWRECGRGRGGCQCHQVWSMEAEVVVAVALGEGDHHMYGETLRDEAQVKANARLIAAAPEMYEALKAIQAWLLFNDKLLDPKGLWNEEFVKANNAACAAISAAEGVE